MSNRTRSVMVALIPALPLLGCATAGSTFRSGVGDAFLEHAPFYAGASASSTQTDTSAIGHMPVAFRRRKADMSAFDPRDGAGTPVAMLLSDLNAALDSLG